MMNDLVMEMTMNAIGTIDRLETPLAVPITFGSGITSPTGRRSELIGAVSWRIACSAHEVPGAGGEAADAVPTAPQGIAAS